MPKATLRFSQADVDRALPQLRAALPQLARLKAITLGAGSLGFAVTADLPLVGETEIAFELDEGGG